MSIVKYMFFNNVLKNKIVDATVVPSGLGVILSIDGGYTCVWLGQKKSTHILWNRFLYFGKLSFNPFSFSLIISFKVLILISSNLLM